MRRKHSVAWRKGGGRGRTVWIFRLLLSLRGVSLTATRAEEDDEEMGVGFLLLLLPKEPKDPTWIVGVQGSRSIWGGAGGVRSWGVACACTFRVKSRLREAGRHAGAAGIGRLVVRVERMHTEVICGQEPCWSRRGGAREAAERLTSVKLFSPKVISCMRGVWGVFMREEE